MAACLPEWVTVYIYRAHHACITCLLVWSPRCAVGFDFHAVALGVGMPKLIVRCIMTVACPESKEIAVTAIVQKL